MAIMMAKTSGIIMPFAMNNIANKAHKPMMKKIAFA
jgi:hypothetical protein